MQLFHIKRFGQEGVGSFLQTFQTVGDITFRRQHHHGDVADIHIRLDHPQQREAIHLGHHDIAHHQIVLLVVLSTQQSAQSLTGTSDGSDMIENTQLLLDILTYLFVIVNDHHPVVRLGFRARCLLFLLRHQHLFGRKMTAAQW